MSQTSSPVLLFRFPPQGVAVEDWFCVGQHSTCSRFWRCPCPYRSLASHGSATFQLLRWQYFLLVHICGTSLAVQWLRVCASNAQGGGSIPGLGIKIPHAAQCSQRKRKSTRMYSQSLTLCQSGCLWIAITYLYEGHHPRIPITSLKLPLCGPGCPFLLSDFGQ